MSSLSKDIYTSLFSQQLYKRTHTQRLTQNPCEGPLSGISWKSCMHVINQNDHISLAHKALFIARNDDTIDFFLPRAPCGNTLSLWCIKPLCVCVHVCVSRSRSHPPPTLDSSQTPPLGGAARSPTCACDIQLHNETQHLTHTPQCHRLGVNEEVTLCTLPEGLALHRCNTSATTTTPHQRPAFPPLFKFLPW